MADHKLAETLKALRIHKGIKQDAVSRELNITRQTYSNYETGKRVPDLDTLCRLAKFYGVTIDQLLVTGLSPFPQSFSLTSLSYLLPEDYFEVVRSYDSLSEAKKEHLREYLRFLEKEMENK